MNILVSSNDNYVMPLTVLLQSIFENCRGEVIKIYFLVSDLSDDNSSLLRDFVERNGAELIFCRIGTEMFAGLPTKKYVSRETYFRLLAAEVLPESVHKVLWLDADMIVHDCIRTLYDIDLGETAVAACPHGSVMKPVIFENCQRIGITAPDQYFNAGMMLCNLDVWRKMDIPARIKSILKEKRLFKFPGQDLTNLIFNGNVMTMDWETYNCMTHSITEENISSATENARIIHFVGSAKPWQFSDLPFSDMWLEYYERSPFGCKPLRRASYFRLKSFYEKMNKGDNISPSGA